MVSAWSAVAVKTVLHFCTTANRVKKDAISRFKNVDWQKVASAAAGIVNPKLAEDIKNINMSNTNEQKVLKSSYISAYKGQLVVRWAPPNGRSASVGPLMFLRPREKENTLRHEAGHYVQYKELGIAKYGIGIFLPSMLNDEPKGYYDRPWEVTADMYGGVDRKHAAGAEETGKQYLEYLKSIDSLKDWGGFLGALPDIINQDLRILDDNSEK